MNEPSNIYSKYKLKLKNGQEIAEAGLALSYSFPASRRFLTEEKSYSMEDVESWEEIL